MKKQSERGFYMVLDTWYVYRCFNGKRYRFTTGCKDLEEAKEWLKRNHPEFLTDNKKSKKEDIDVSDASKFKFTSTWYSETLSRVKYRNKAIGAKPISFNCLETIVRRSKGKCELTGIPFNCRKIGKASRLPFIPSIDRISPNLPYTKSNCRIVCLAVNVALNEWGEEVLDLLVKSRANYILGLTFAIANC